MIAHPGILGNFTRDKFFKTPVIANEYIPFYAFQTIDTGFYHKPSLETGVIRKPNTVKNIKDAFQMALTPRRITIGGVVYFFVKGVMFTDTGTPLMVFAMPREKFLDPDIKKFSEIRYSNEISPVDYKNFVLFYSTSFFTEPSLAPLNRRFQKEILMSCYQKGIEVRVITSQEIERNTFADLFEIPKANSVSQLEEYMRTVLPTYLFTEEEDTFVFDELPQAQTQQEELSLEEEALLFDSEEPTSYNPPDWNGEYQVEIEEMAREAATWDSAHTESNNSTDNMNLDPESNPSRNITVYMGSEGARIFMSALEQEAVQPLDYAVANAEAAITTHVTQVGNVTWRSRNNRPIELIDDEV